MQPPEHRSSALWTAFRRRRWFVQAAAWVALAPVVAGLWVWRTRFRGAAAAGAAITLAGSVAYYPLAVNAAWPSAPRPVAVRLAIPTAPPDGLGSPAPAPSPEPGPAVARAQVTRVVDGDTAVMTVDGRTERVRFIGVDTPESTTRLDPYGKEASSYTSKALTGKTVWLERDAQERDRYGRLLAYVWMTRPAQVTPAFVREQMFNARLLADGYAQQLTVPPNIKYVDELTALVAQARAAGRGLWAGPASATSQRSSQPDLSNSNGAGTSCDPSYPDVCIPPPPPDLDCKDVPYHNFRVVGADPHGFDSDRDGIGCER